MRFVFNRQIVAWLLLATVGTASAYPVPSAEAGVRDFATDCLTTFLDALSGIKGAAEDAAARTLTPDEVARIESRPVEQISVNDILQSKRSDFAKKLYAKVLRALDIGYATVAIPLATPVAGFFALMIRMDSDGPVFYLANRVGEDGVPIRVKKLRTMRVGADKGGSATQAGDSRIAGQWAAKARRYKIDELPQLLDVLSGKLSVSGPRPLDVREVNAIDQKIPGFAKLRHEGVKPGLADAAQATHPHSGDINTPEGIEARKKKYLAELAGRKAAEEDPIVEYHKNILLVLKSIIDGTGSQ